MVLYFYVFQIPGLKILYSYVYTLFKFVWLNEKHLRRLITSFWFKIRYYEDEKSTTTFKLLIITKKTTICFKRAFQSHHWVLNSWLTYNMRQQFDLALYVRNSITKLNFRITQRTKQSQACKVLKMSIFLKINFKLV